MRNPWSIETTLVLLTLLPWLACRRYCPGYGVFGLYGRIRDVFCDKNESNQVQTCSSRNPPTLFLESQALREGSHSNSRKSSRGSLVFDNKVAPSPEPAVEKADPLQVKYSPVNPKAVVSGFMYCKHSVPVRLMAACRMWFEVDARGRSFAIL